MSATSGASRGDSGSEEAGDQRILKSESGSGDSSGGNLETPIAVPQSSARGVLCIKCNHVNPQGIELCETCGTHLFVNCRECGTKNARVNPRCVNCSRRMHKKKKRATTPTTGVNKFYVALVLVGIVAVIILILALSGANPFK